jgi:hypothetical protein
MGSRGLRLIIGIALVAPVLAVTAASAGPVGAGSSFRERLIREGRVSGVVHPEGRWLGAGGLGSPLATCSAPGGTNYMADCNSAGWPTNETTIATNGATFVAGANDYNSYNNHAQLGFYSSKNGTTWNDAGPLDLYPHDPDNGAGDPGLAIDSNGVVYYSNIFFSYTDPVVGGVELARRDPTTLAWTTYQIADNTNSTFQDKPAIVISGRHVFESWTYFANNSTIKVAQFKLGAGSAGPTKILDVPGSGNSQGSAMAPDGDGGFWITWEEGSSIKLAHWLRGFWTEEQTISPDGFRDLPSPLPGFNFRTSSFPMIALVHGSPYVVWASYDTGAGRTYLYANGTVTTVSDTGGDQFYASIGSSRQGYAISWSQTGAKKTFDQYMWFAGSVTKISTHRSKPNRDCRFDPPGAFIGDYNSTIMNGAAPMPIWTDLRRHSQACDGRAQDAILYVP